MNGTKPSNSPTWVKNKLGSETKFLPVCIIPAKKDSKRLPGKNKMVLGGKPLVQHAIDLAVESHMFSMIIVSSDDEEIIEMAYESKVFPHLRPDILRLKNVQQKDICDFILHLSQVPKADVFCLLPVCNPFTTVDDLKKSYDLLWQKKGNYVMSVVKANPPPQLAMAMRKGWMVPVMGFEATKQSQKLEPNYYPDGRFIWARREIFELEIEYGFKGSKVIPYFCQQMGIDIDTKEDFDYAVYLWVKQHLTNILVPGINA